MTECGVLEGRFGLTWILHEFGEECIFAANHQVASIRIIKGSKDLRERTTRPLRSVSRAGQPESSVTT